MKFTKLLHPEVAMGLRGPEEAQFVYQSVLAQTSWNGTQWTTNAQMAEIDRFFSSHVCLVRRWMDSGRAVYHSGKEFTQALMRVNRRIPADLMPKPFVAYFSFPDNTVFDEADEVVGAYIAVIPTKETPYAGTRETEDETALWGSYVTRNGAIGDLRMPLVPDFIESIISEHDSSDMKRDSKGRLFEDKTELSEENKQKRWLIFRLLINLVLYVGSVDPDLDLQPPVKKLKPAQKKWIGKTGGLLNQCLLPVTFVSWSYRHPTHYNVDSTWVDTFMRWQRMGPGLSQVKLIWVREHARTFKK